MHLLKFVQLLGCISQPSAFFIFAYSRALNISRENNLISTNNSNILKANAFKMRLRHRNFWRAFAARGKQYLQKYHAPSRRLGGLRAHFTFWHTNSCSWHNISVSAKKYHFLPSDKSGVFIFSI